MSTSTDPGRQPRTIVLCFDGTSNEYDEDNTNVVKFFSLLKKDDFNEQPCYYQAGIGTFFAPGVVSPLFEWGAKVLDQAIAWYLDQHVMDGYRFLMQNYRAGDKICIFGFSRGAYTGRAVAGMLYKIGLLPKDNEEQIPFAFKLYKKEDKTSDELSAGFKRTYCQDVKIEFMGLWDTVSSVGLLMEKTLPFISSNRAIKTFRHALSLDERRAKFKANLYHRPAPNDSAAALDPEHGSRPSETSTRSDGNGKLVSGKRWSFPREKTSFMTRGHSPGKMPEEEETDVLEVWFSGCHSDVGGGSVLNSEPYSLGNISLRWMVKQVVRTQCGVMFDNAALLHQSIGFMSSALADTGPQLSQEDGIDALQPIHDELKPFSPWWLLEVIPLSYSWQDAQGVWHRAFGFNLGKGRCIADGHPKFHVSVKLRRDSKELAYKPKAIWEAGTETYVD